MNRYTFTAEEVEEPITERLKLVGNIRVDNWYRLAAAREKVAFYNIEEIPKRIRIKSYDKETDLLTTHCGHTIKPLVLELTYEPIGTGTRSERAIQMAQQEVFQRPTTEDKDEDSDDDNWLD